jgi:hypothetical protein
MAVTLANSSSTPQTIARAGVNGGEFGISGLHLPVTLTPGESITFDTTFTPVRAAGSAGNLILETQGSDLAIALDGQGSAIGYLTASPANLNFSNVMLGNGATVQGKLIAGTTDVTVYSAGITSSEFALSGVSFPLTIPAGQSKAYTVTFTPTSSGTASAIISFRSSGDSPAEQALAGTGVPKASHSVNLSWNSSGQGVVGYNVFRASSLTGPYSKITSIPDSNTSYLDSTVQGGQTYFYVTTAVASNGKQSAYSNWVEVIIP